MKAHVTVSIDTDIYKKIRQKNLNASQIAENSFRDALNVSKKHLKTSKPENNLLLVWNQIPKRWQTKAMNVFSEKKKGLVPNLKKKIHLEELLKINMRLRKQTMVILYGLLFLCSGLLALYFLQEAFCLPV